MNSIGVPRIMLSGAMSSVGKSLLTLGLVHEFRRRGLGVGCCVSGPHLLQATVLSRLSGHYVNCLDQKLLSSDQLLTSLYLAGVGADILLIDGRRGLYDDLGEAGSAGSDAEVAVLSKTPVVLVVDASSMDDALHSFLKGYFANARGFTLCGVILNSLTGGFDSTLLRKRMEDAGFGTPLGIVPAHADTLPALPKFYAQHQNVTSFSRQFFVDVGKLVQEHLEVDYLIELAEKAESVVVPGFELSPARRKAKIAVSQDGCFSVGFQNNLNLLRYFGAEIVPFSPLADSSLPAGTGGVYITGAFVHDYAEDLARNKSMHESLQRFAQSGGVIYSEGGGTAFLCETYQAGEDRKTYAGVGLIPGTAIPRNFTMAYTENVMIEDTILGNAGLMFRGLHGAEWELRGESESIKTIRISFEGSRVKQEGYSPMAQMLSTFGFLLFESNPGVAETFVDASSVVCSI